MIELTVAVISVGDLDSLRKCLGQLVPQLDGHPVEVLVPCDSTMPGTARLSAEFPQVEFLDLGTIRTDATPGTITARHEVFDRRMSAALAASRGSVVSFLQDWGLPDKDWCVRMLAAHRNMPHAAIGGGVEHAGGGALNWAVFFQDFARYQAPIPEGPAQALTDVNVAYKKRVLDEIAGIWRERFNEVTINGALLEKGEVLWQSPDIIVRQDRGRLSLGPLLGERFSWGRIRGGARAYQASLPKRLAYLVLTPLVPVLLLIRIGRKVFGGGRYRSEFIRCLPALILLLTAWSAGEFWGTLTGRPSPTQISPAQILPQEESAGMNESVTPDLSVVVAIVSDTATGRGDAAHLTNCLEALEAQQNPPSMEVIVPHHPYIDGLAEVKKRFPHVRFLLKEDLKKYSGRPGNREHHNELRAYGIHQARGGVIALIEDHGCPQSNWCERIMKAHRQPAAAWGGAMENSVPAAINWAVYLSDFYLYQDPFPETPSAHVTDANVSYKRAALEKIRTVWNEVFHELAVNRALSDLGETIMRSPDIVVCQRRMNLTLPGALKERFSWGRSFAADRVRAKPGSARVIYAGMSVLLPAVLVLRIAAATIKKGHAGRFFKALPFIALLSGAWSAGELTGYLTGRVNGSAEESRVELAGSGTAAGK